MLRLLPRPNVRALRSALVCQPTALGQGPRPVWSTPRSYSTHREDNSRSGPSLGFQASVAFLTSATAVIAFRYFESKRDASMQSTDENTGNGVRQAAVIHCDSPQEPQTERQVLARSSDATTEGEQIKRRSGSSSGSGAEVLSGKVAGASQGQGPVKDDDSWDPVKHNEWDDPRNPMRLRMSTWVMELQDQIVNELERIEASVPPNEYNSSFEPPKFNRDHWLRPQGGEGASCVMAGGRVFEKAGVSISVIHGTLPPPAIRQMKADHKSLQTDGKTSLPFFVAGISLVLHPWNPHAPTVHANYRYFEVDHPDTDNTAQSKDTREPLAWWFGGGSDLTPSYLYEEDAKHFHQTIKDAAERFNPDIYPEWKKWCDEYFYIPHRGEARGIGGIFFDDLTISSDILNRPGREPPKSADDIFRLIKSLSSSFLPSYIPILTRRMNMDFTEEERRWQLIRRGRYVEFNLVHDRGTKFGLFTPGARIESVLMTLPQNARWEYMSPLGAPGSGTREEELMKVLKEPKNWV